MKPLTELKFSIEHVLTLPAEPPSYLECIWLDKGEEYLQDKDSNVIQNGAPLPFAISPVTMAVIDSARCHSKGEDVKTVFELVLDVKDINPDYMPGDTVGIMPKNPEAEIISLMKCLELSDKADEPLKVILSKETTKKKAVVPNYLPQVSTVFNILENSVDIRAIPKKLFLRALCKYTQNSTEKRRLEELCSREGANEYSTSIVESGITILDLLQAFESCKPPLSLLLEHLPRLQPRAYSIASSPLENPTKIRVVLNIVVTSKGREGVCSSWLYKLCQPFMDISHNFKNLRISGEAPKVWVPVYFRKPTNFRIPSDTSVPLLMVGPGTGVAPFLGFLQHRGIQYKSESCVARDNWLFFGCRYKDRDYIFKEELNTHVQQGTLSKLYTSFSRNSESGSTKYVQDNIKQTKVDFLDKLLNANSHLFICGDVKNMITDVEEAIITCIMEVKGIMNTSIRSAFYH